MKITVRILAIIATAVLLLCGCAPQMHTQGPTAIIENTESTKPSGTTSSTQGTAPSNSASAEITPSPTVEATPTPSAGIPSEWDVEFTYGSVKGKGSALTKFSGGVQGTVSGEDYGTLSFTAKGVVAKIGKHGFVDTYTAYSGSNIDHIDYTKMKYLCIEIINNEKHTVDFAFQCFTKNGKTVQISDNGGKIILAARDGKLSDAGVLYTSYRNCLTLPASFDGCVLIPVDRLFYASDDNGAKWDGNAFSSVGFHMADIEKGTAGITLKSIFSLKELPKEQSGNQGGNQGGNQVSTEYVQKPSIRDWTQLWWKNGFKVTKGQQLNIQTGYYGMSIEPARGTITHLGYINKEYSQVEAAAADSSVIEGLGQIAGMDFAMAIDNEYKPFKSITAISDLNYGTQTMSRIIESGRYMQRIDIMNINFQNETDITGRLEIAAMPRYFSADFSIWSKAGRSNPANIAFSFTLGGSYVSYEKSEDGKVAVARMADGRGLVFVLPNQEGATLDVNPEYNKITITFVNLKVKARDFVGGNVIVIPSANAKLHEASIYYDNEQASVSAEQIEPRKSKKQPAEFDKKGYMAISLNGMTTTNTSDFEQNGRLDDMDRLIFTLKNDKDHAITVPIKFYKEGAFGYIGCAPMLRDATTGEPIGVPVQLSKNWHTAVDFDSKDPATYLDGAWFSGYTYITVPANSEVTYEFCMTYATWGGVFAASHSQLCLVGWGGGYQQWESSSIGSFGESFCYEAEMTHGRGFITDVRPLLVESIYGGKYNFTENIGGGNFLFYKKSPGGAAVGYKNVVTEYRKQGPNLTEVIYNGTTADGAIKYKYTVNLPRTNDVSRVYHTFEYTFLADTTFDRLAFYQLGTDEYNDNHWDTMAVGNMDGTVSVNFDGNTYSGEFALPTMQNVGYFGNGKMQRIEVGGEGLWVAFMGYKPVLWKKEPGANRMLNLMSYNATINGKTYTKPSLSFYHTLNGGVSCVAVELSPAAECGNTIKAGSVVTGTVEWLNMPVAKDDYYGPSEILKNMPASYFNTYKLAYSYAKGGYYSVSASTGTVTKKAPAYIACKKDAEVAAEITVKGGIGYVPLTFTGLKSFSGYRLQKKVNGKWEIVDQSVNGNDYWQAWYDSVKGTYELTFNVEHNGNPGATYDYRLVKIN